MELRSLIIQLLPIVTGAYVEFNLLRGWITVFPPRVMRQVPVKDAWSAMIRVDAREVGGLGAVGIVEVRLEDDILVVRRAIIGRNYLGLLLVNEPDVSCWRPEGVAIIVSEWTSTVQKKMPLTS